MVSFDSGRTMATSLGAGVVIDPEAVALAFAGTTAGLYLEGYLLDSPGTYSRCRACSRAREGQRGFRGPEPVRSLPRRTAR